MECPTGYSTGYGKGVQYSPYPITNRCYMIEHNPVASFNDAQPICRSKRANLITVRNTLEMGIIRDQFIDQSKNYLV